MLTMLSIEIVGRADIPFLHAAKGKPKKRRPLESAATEAAERPRAVHEKEREVPFPQRWRYSFALFPRLHL